MKKCHGFYIGLTNGLVVDYIESNFSEDSDETPRVQVQAPSACAAAA
jgi:hypothetical protein